MNKLSKKIVSLALCFSALNLSSNVFANEKVESILGSLVSNGAQGFFLSPDNFLVDSQGTILKFRKKPILVPDSLRSHFLPYNEKNLLKSLSVNNESQAFAPIHKKRSNDEILESLSKCNHNLGRSVSNELIFKNSGEKISGNNGVIKVTDKYFENFPLAELEMTDEFYEFLEKEGLVTGDPDYPSVWRNEHGWLVDEFGYLLKLNESDNKYISVPERYYEKIKVHPWVDGVHKGEVFLDISNIGNGDEHFKVVNKNKELIGPDLTPDDCFVGEWSSYYYHAPDGIRIPLLDYSDKNLQKFNQSGGFVKRSLYGSFASREVLYFGRQLSNQSISKQPVAQEQQNSSKQNVEFTDEETVRRNESGINSKDVIAPLALITSLIIPNFIDF